MSEAGQDSHVTIDGEARRVAEEVRGRQVPECEGPGVNGVSSHSCVGVGGVPDMDMISAPEIWPPGRKEVENECVILLLLALRLKAPLKFCRRAPGLGGGHHLSLAMPSRASYLLVRLP